MKWILAALVTAVGINAMAFVTVKPQINYGMMEAQFKAQAKIMNRLGWKVGDRTDYVLQLASFEGTVAIYVREQVGEDFWVNQDIEILGQKQVVEMLIDSNTGELKKLIVNGKEEALPEPGDTEIVETREEQVTVPAGTFDAIYAVIKDNKSNEETKVWLNMDAIPVYGLIKQIAPSQIGEVILELTSFQK